MSPITTSLSVNGNVIISCDITTGDYLATWSSPISSGNLTYSFYNPNSGWTPPEFISNSAKTSGDIFSAFNSSANQFLTTWPNTTDNNFIFAPSYSFFNDIVPATLPNITEISPSFGLKYGKKTKVTITGTNFIGATAVLFGSIPASKFIVESNSIIRAIAPRGHGTVDVRVISSGGESLITSNDHFTYIPSPPRHLNGKQEKCMQCRFLNLRNIIKWNAPASGHPIAYRIYDDKELTHLIGEIPANHPLRFLEKIQCNSAKKSMTYYVVSVDSHGIQSLPAKTTIGHHD